VDPEDPIQLRLLLWLVAFLLSFCCYCCCCPAHRFLQAINVSPSRSQLPLSAPALSSQELQIAPTYLLSHSQHTSPSSTPFLDTPSLTQTLLASSPSPPQSDSIAIMVHLAQIPDSDSDSSLAKKLRRVSLKLANDDDCFTTSVYGSRFASVDLPRHEMPEDEMPRDVAYRMIKDDLSLDGNPMLKLVSRGPRSHGVPAHSCQPPCHICAYPEQFRGN